MRSCFIFSPLIFDLNFCSFLCIGKRKTVLVGEGELF